MEALLFLSGLAILVWVMAFFGAPLALWSLALAGAAGAGQRLWGRPWSAASLVGWTFIAGLILLLNLPALRRRMVTAPLARAFRRRLPPLSATEREALEAGTVSWDGELFGGRPAWGRLLAMPTPSLSAEEQAFLDGPVEEFCCLLDDWRIVEEGHDLPPEAWAFLKRHRFFGLGIPRKYDGLGFSALAHSQVIIKVASRSCAAVVTVMVPNSLGPAELLLHYGTEEQRLHYLPRLARGQELPCFALTGPDAGSDAASIPDAGVVCRGTFEGREIVGVRLNWEKRYITLGPVATLLGLAFRLSDPERLLQAGGEGITLALIPTGTPGITIGNRHNAMGIPFQVGPNWGREVFIPLDWIIGGPAGAGRGWKMLMESLAAGRSISLPGLSTGAGKLAALVAGAYARIRKQFRMPIGRFEGVEEALARIAGHTYLMDAARTLTCGAVDQGGRPSVLSAIVKYQCSERMRLVVNDAMDILGGSGICLGPRNLLARTYQAVPIGITVEGANILTRTLIIFGQGVIRSHPHVLDELRALGEGDPGAGLSAGALAGFDRHLGLHLRHGLGNAARALFHGLTGGRLARIPGGPGRPYYQALSRYSAAFALAADVALATLGGGLKRREKLSGRMADVLSHLYLASAALKQFEDRGRPAADLPLLRWACESCLLRIEDGLLGLIRNLPNRPAAGLLRLLIFPAGRCRSGPSDALGHHVAGLLLEPSPARDRLTSGIFLPMDPKEPLGRLEDALRKAVAAEPLERRLGQAVAAGRIPPGDDAQLAADGLRQGVLRPEEADILLQAREARREVTRVDDFPPVVQPRG